MIEYKGYRDKLVKLDSDKRVDNKTSKKEPNYKNINNYAVNGAVLYVNAILHYTSYTDVIAIGVTGYKYITNKIQHSVGVCYMSKNNLGIGQEVGTYTDLSFLRKENFNNFIKKINELALSTEELQELKKNEKNKWLQSL